MKNTLEKTIQIPHDIIVGVFGEYDNNIKIIENKLGVNIINRDNEVKIIGEDHGVQTATRVIKQLIETANKKIEINEQNVNYTLSLCEKQKEEEMSKLNNDLICITPGGKHIRPKTLGQKKYIDLIRKKMVVFDIANLTSKDVVRHPLVQKIVNAYENYESKKNKR